MNLLLIVYWTALFVGTHIPLPQGALPGESDKLAHFVAYAGLAFLLALRVSTARRITARHALLIVLLVSGYAAVDELLQTPVGRQADMRDWGADVVGVLIGLGVFWGARAVWSAWSRRPRKIGPGPESRGVGMPRLSPDHDDRRRK